MGRTLNIRPTTGVYATYKNIRYNPWTAIAEFVDNSTQSFYDHENQLKETKYWKGLNVDVFFEIDSITNKETLIIKDNAYGMDYNDFKRAIILDSPPKKTSRSEFGMGLKTAACWFGTMWSVESTELGSGITYKTKVDVEALHKYKHECIDVEEISCSKKKHGTIIKIWNLNRRILGRATGKTKDQLRGMYRTDLRTGRIHISYNHENLFYEDPEILSEELPDGTKKLWKQDIEFTILNNNKEFHVSGFIAIRKKGSTSNAGFTLMRHGRVIVGGYENTYRPEEIFEQSNSFIYQRLFGELNLNDWSVTQTKDAFDWYNGLEDQLIEKLNIICKEYKQKAKDYRKREKIDVPSSFNKIADDFVSAGIIEKHKVENSFSEYTQISDIEDSDSALELIDNKPQVLRFSTSPTNIYNIIYSLINDDPDRNWLTVYEANEPETYIVELNIAHPFFEPYIKEPEFIRLMEKFAFAIVIAELDACNSVVSGLEIPPSFIRKKMNISLKSVSKVDSNE